jgi:nitroimidazol reductase NimA-like FMN-containing flavoprotein (pyridoxamine 5'-phosphate oxidase superfamily)
MQYQMRRMAQRMDKAWCRKLLEQGEWGVLATADRAGQPYGVPVDYVALEDKIYFHGAAQGTKIQNIALNPRVTFCVIGATRVRPEAFSRDYESVLVHGRAKVVVGEEKRRAMTAFVEKFCSAHRDGGMAKLERELERVFVVGIAIEQMTGKTHKVDDGAPEA